MIHWRITFRIFSFWFSLISFKYTSNFSISKMLPFIWNQMFVDRNFWSKIFEIWCISTMLFINWDYVNNSFSRTRANLCKRQASMHPRFLIVLSLLSSIKELTSSKKINLCQIFHSRLYSRNIRFEFIRSLFRWIKLSIVSNRFDSFRYPV